MSSFDPFRAQVIIHSSQAVIRLHTHTHFEIDLSKKKVEVPICPLLKNKTKQG